MRILIADRLVPARDLSSGQQHVRLMRGVDARAGRIETRLHIVSAGWADPRGAQARALRVHLRRSRQGRPARLGRPAPHPRRLPHPDGGALRSLSVAAG